MRKPLFGRDWITNKNELKYKEQTLDSVDHFQIGWRDTFTEVSEKERIKHLT